MIIGRTYLERGAPVVVLVQWSGAGPRNVLVERADGTRVVRPLRGLRRPDSGTAGVKFDPYRPTGTGVGFGEPWVGPEPSPGDPRSVAIDDAS